MNKTIVILLVFVISACTSPIMSTTTTKPTSTSLSTDKDLCEWFNKSQEIRTERIPAILIIQDVAEKYSGVTFDFNNTTMMNDYKNAIKEFIAVNEKFIDSWKKLGVHPLARDYWENELKAVETYKEGYSLSLRGFNERKAELIQEGAEIYETGNIASNKAEDVMIDLRKECR